MKTTGYIIFLLFVFTVRLLPGQDVDLGTDAQRDAGQELYLDKCAHCHGESGDGEGVAGPYFRPRPRDFTAGTYKFRSTASGELPSDTDIMRSIREGMPYTGMPPWPNLSEDQVTNLMYHLKTYSDDFAGPFGEVEEIPVPDAPNLTDDSIERGQEVYVENQCFDCHGYNGLGNGDSAPTLEDKWGIHIKPADLTKRWTFRNGQTREDIWRTITTGLDGSPMPSYEFDSPEDQWALVDFVYSLSRDEPEYSTVAFARGIEGELDITQGDALFAGADLAFFPIVGQVIEPGRAFFPGVNAVEVAAVYNASDIAVMLKWHDMSAQRSGSNSLTADVGAYVEEAELDSTLIVSDAVALLFPSVVPEGTEKPYFMLGDDDHPVDIWFGDMGTQSADVFVGRGSTDIQNGTGGLEMYAQYDEGEWTAIFKRTRLMEEGLSFEEEQFIPIAFSIWDGFYKERGNKRGLSSWYALYMEPMEQESPVVPMLSYSLITLLLSLGVVSLVRRKFKDYPSEL